MLALIIISLIAVVSFRSAAKKKGYDSPQFWAYPILVGAVVLLVSFCLNTLVGIILGSHGVMALYPFVVSMLAIAVECAVLSKLWKQIKALPDRQAIETGATPASCSNH